MVSLLVSACGGSSDDLEPTAPGMLEAGELVVGVDGVTVGAPIDALDAPLAVEIERLPRPEAALPVGASLEGDAYAVSAPEYTRALNDSTFIVGVPLPADMPEELAEVAVLARASSTLDLAEDTWFLAPAQYEPETGLLLIANVSLDAEATVLSLARLDDPPVEGSVVEMQPKQGGVPLVEAKCSGFSARVTGCTTDVKRRAEQAFEEAHRTLIAAGYPQPALARAWPLKTSNLGAPLPPSPYEIVIKPCPATCNTAGKYSPSRERVSVYLGSDGFADDTVFALRHELFHAIQYAFPLTRPAAARGAAVSWAIEGQAAVAEHTRGNPELLRSPDYALRSVGVPLLEEPVRTTRSIVTYRTQDFWAYLGARLNRGIDLFIPFLENGLTGDEVSATLGSNFGAQGFPDLGTAYWEWVKNHAYESQVPVPTGNASGVAPTPPRPPCDASAMEVFQGAALGLMEFSPAGGLVGSLIQGSEAIVDSVPPLATRTFGVELSGSEIYNVRVATDREDSNLRYKIYPNITPSCATEPEGVARTITTTGGGLDFVIVLVSNTSTTDTLEDIAFDVSLVRVTAQPERLDLAGVVEQTTPTNFELRNDTAGPVTFSASTLASWLSLSGDSMGTIPAGGTFEVDLEAACRAEGRFEGEVALSFEDAMGAPIESGVPAAVPITLDCAASDSCMPLTFDREITGSASLMWMDNAIEGDRSFSANVDGTVELVSSLLGDNVVGSGFVRATSITPTPGGDPVVVDYNGLGPVLTMGRNSFVALTILDDCSYSFTMNAVIDGTFTVSSEENPLGTPTTFVVASAKVSGQVYAGSVLNGSMSVSLPPSGVPPTDPSLENFFQVDSRFINGISSIKGRENVATAVVSWGFAITERP
ncbi:MAG: hypothetical protein AAF436_12090 [Myxococcota bacterium]